jgi:PKD repeat protein
MININYKILSLLLFGSSLFAQQDAMKHCGHTQAQEALYKIRPDLKIAQLKHEEEINFKPIQNFSKTNLTSPYIIPVVFHIMHDYGAENISDAQVIDAVRILNEDFQMRNADTANIVQSFKTIKANVNFEFRLAKKDPQGNCTNGILHVPSILTNSGSDAVKFDQWPPNKYLNIWVVKKIASGAAGYAYYPSSADGWPDIDGIVILSNYVGSVGTGTYGRSRALTHEVGHYMDLAHVWGSTNNPGEACGDDGVLDTPETKGWQNCNLIAEDCNPGIVENIQNYMEYAYCSNMYTAGQKQRMTNAITSSIADRNNLWSNTNLLATGTDNIAFTSTVICKPKADFGANFKSICAGNSILFTDLSFNAPVTNQQWLFQGGTPSSSTQYSQAVTYSNPGLYEVKLKVSNSQGQDSITKSQFIKVLPTVSPNGATLLEGFETINLSSSDWEVRNGGDQHNWTVVSVGSNSSKSLRLLNNNATEGDVDEFITPSMNLNGLTNMNLSFDVAYARRNDENNDRLRILISKDCGKSWTQRFSKQGANLSTTTNFVTGNFTPNSSQWRNETMALQSVFIGSNTMLKFEFINSDGNNVYIDNINIGFSQNINEYGKNILLDVDVFPNPSSGLTNLIISSEQDNDCDIEVLDVLGKLVFSQPKQNIKSGENQITLDLSHLNSGIYYLNVNTKLGFISKKLVIQ